MGRPKGTIPHGIGDPLEAGRALARGERLPAVDWIRGWAAIAVAWFHLTSSYGGTARASGSLGWLGLDCFFVISGFVIPLSLHGIGYRINRFPAFMARRLIRLELPYLFSIALVMALQIGSSLSPGFGGRSPDYAPVQIALHAFYLIPVSDYAWLNPAYWSLAYEFAFYVLAGLLFGVLWRRPLVLTIVLVCGVSLLVEPDAPHVSRVPLFLMGIAAARRRVGRDSPLAFGFGLVCAVAAMGFGKGGGPSVEAALSALFGCATALVVPTASASGRRSPWLGTVSYALYLTHVPVGGRVVNLGRRIVDGPVQECLLSLVALAVCLAFAEAFRRLFEAPFVRLSRRVSLGGEADDPGSRSGGAR